MPRAQDVNFEHQQLRIFQPPASCEGRPHIPNEQCWDVLVSQVKAVPGRWTFWAITRSGSTARLYMDGKPAPALTVPWDDEFIFRAIAHARTGYTSGSIDEVAVYEHALGARLASCALRGEMKPRAVRAVAVDPIEP